jgi:hypothetical protein
MESMGYVMGFSPSISVWHEVGRCLLLSEKYVGDLERVSFCFHKIHGGAESNVGELDTGRWAKTVYKRLPFGKFTKLEKCGAAK